MCIFLAWVIIICGFRVIIVSWFYLWVVRGVTVLVLVGLFYLGMVRGP